MLLKTTSILDVPDTLHCGFVGEKITVRGPFLARPCSIQATQAPRACDSGTSSATASVQLLVALQPLGTSGPSAQERKALRSGAAAAAGVGVGKVQIEGW